MSALYRCDSLLQPCIDFTISDKPQAPDEKEGMSRSPPCARCRHQVDARLQGIRRSVISDEGVDVCLMPLQEHFAHVA